MYRKIIGGLVCLAVVWAATATFAQVTPGGTPSPYKTPPMRESDVWHIPIDYHNPVDVLNWAGALMTIHILDPSEVDIDAVGTADGIVTTEPFGPRSQNLGSLTLPFSVWDPNAPNSGRLQPASAVIPVGGIDVHAKNTDPINNSDTDIVAKVYNIHHLGPVTQSSQVLTLQPSEWVYGNPGTNPILASELPTAPPEPGQGVWYHATDIKTFHLFSGPGSNYYAKFVGTINIGIEHVPEPTALVMLGSGVVCAVIGLWTRRRNRSCA
jgi:hypothetical protein